LINVNPSSGQVNQGQEAQTQVNLTLLQGTTQSVSFYALGLPSGASVNFNPTACSPSCSSSLTINTSPSTPTGTHNISICGSTTGLSDKCVIYQLTVNAAGAQVTSPQVGTIAATNVATSTATLNGNLSNMGNAPFCWVWFEYGVNPSSLNASTTLQKLTSTGSFYANLSNLSASTTYYFKATAKNGGSW